MEFVQFGALKIVGVDRLKVRQCQRVQLMTECGTIKIRWKGRLKGGKTQSEGSFKRRRDSSRAGFRREQRDNASCHVGTVKAELEFSEQVPDADEPYCNSQHIL